MKKTIGIMVAMVLSFGGLAMAASEVQYVTMSVPSILSISSETSEINLRFIGFERGAETQVATVKYNIAFNNSTVTDGAVSAILSGAFKNAALQADVVGYYKKSGNARLAEQNAGFVTIGPDKQTPLAKRLTDSGSGKASTGTLAVNYKGIARDMLEPGTETKKLTITLVDA